MDVVWEEIPLRMGLVFPSRRTKLAHKRHPIITQMNKESCAAGIPASSNTNGKLRNQRWMGILGAGGGSVSWGIWGHIWKKGSQEARSLPQTFPSGYSVVKRPIFILIFHVDISRLLCNPI